MRTWKKLPLLTAIAAALTVPATASAQFQHVVASGESLSSVAAADGLSVAQLAAANGISPDAQLIAGSAIAIPPQAGSVSSPGDESPSATPAAEQASTTGGSSAGGYLVQPGDTLSAIAARYGVSVSALAAANGLDPAGLLISGTTINLSGATAGGAPTTEMVSAPVPSVDGGAGAQPTAEMVSPSEVGSIAAENGVSPALAEAIGDQESGFNNDEVSSTGATGVMQIEPGTWNYIGQNLVTPPPLSPDSATDNIRGGVLLLHSLLNETGGDPAMAAAAYYQGLQSVQQHGLFSDTQRYVNDVMALSQRFGGQ
jgi:N-acetylmuramoyl-L-alanine amidase